MGSATINGVGENVPVSGLEARGTPPQDRPLARPGSRDVLAEAWFWAKADFTSSPPSAWGTFQTG